MTSIAKPTDTGRDRTTVAPESAESISTGVDGLDQVLGGGLTPGHMYLVEGTPGTGKTSFALNFLMAGARIGQKGLYITLSETESELRQTARTHGWSLDGLEFYELVSSIAMSADVEQTILHPSEVELGETVGALIEQIGQVQPDRIVLDSLSEMRLLAQDPLKYRRQVLALKSFFSSRDCTVLLIDDKTSDPGDLQLHSLAHGVITLTQSVQPYGAERRAMRIVKMRGRKYQGGSHDFAIKTGQVVVYPRLVAADHRSSFDAEPVSSGCEEFDALLGGGLSAGTNTLLVGPSGVGKTTTSISLMLTALKRGQRCGYFLFDEGLGTFLRRAQVLDMDLTSYIDSGQLQIFQIDPSDLSPGEFANRVVDLVQHKDVSMIAIDSINAYLHSMSGSSHLVLHMHELLMYLNQAGVVTILVVGEHGLIGDMRSEIDLSFISDCAIAYRYFEARGEVRIAVTAVKSRALKNERSIREFRVVSGKGIEVGAPLRDFVGIFGGVPRYDGSAPMLDEDDG